MSQSHADAAALVITGKVISVKKSNDPLMGSEHDPIWYQAQVEVRSVLKGTSIVKQLMVLYPNSIDVNWYKVPKLRVGDEGTFTLHHNPRIAGEYLILDPADFVPAAAAPSLD